MREIARVLPGWYVASSRIRSPSDARRVISYLEEKYRGKRWFAAAMRKTVPTPAHPHPLASCLQNLPAFQHMRCVLLTRWIENALPVPSAIRRAGEGLNVAPCHLQRLLSFGAHLRGETNRSTG